MNDEQQRTWRLAEDRLWRAWYASLIGACAFLLLTLLVAQDPSIPRQRVWMAVGDAAITILLGWTMQRWRSRVAAALLLLQNIWAVIGWLRMGVWVSGAVTTGFGILYAYGLYATITMRRLAPSSSAMQGV